MYRRTDFRHWEALTQIIGIQRALENAEYGARRGDLSVLVEMGRLCARQFPWQRGFFTVRQLYRNVFIYGRGEAAACFEDTVGISVEEMTFVGYSLLSVFYGHPTIRIKDDLPLIHELGVSPGALGKALARIARPLTDARSEAAILRAGDAPIAYKPSYLRRYPCILVGPRNRDMIAPLPDLIMDRVTSGLFYDIVGGGGAVRKDTGNRFERYALDLLAQMLFGDRCRPEFSYMTGLGQIHSPDILVTTGQDTVRLAIECKANHMTLDARFGETPDEERGYEEIAKGVMQLWRYFAHCRQRRVHSVLDDAASGMILTLDDWFAARSTIIPKILARANTLADQNPHQILAVDRRSIAFCTISELEDCLTTATVESFFETVGIASAERQGWIFAALHQECTGPKTEPKPYPFDNALGDLLPWFSRLETLGED